MQFLEYIIRKNNNHFSLKKNNKFMLYSFKNTMFYIKMCHLAEKFRIIYNTKFKKLIIELSVSEKKADNFDLCMSKKSQEDRKMGSEFKTTEFIILYFGVIKPKLFFST